MLAEVKVLSMDTFRCNGKSLLIVQRLYLPTLTALPVRFYYRTDLGSGEDDDKQEVFQSHVINMDTSARSKVGLVSTVRYSSVIHNTLIYSNSENKFSIYLIGS
jgi:hypothetical protein